MLQNSFSLKHLSITTGNLLWPKPCRVMSPYRNNTQDILKKYSENFIETLKKTLNHLSK